MNVMFLNSFNLLKFIFFHVFFILLARNNIIFGLTNKTDQHALLAVKDLIVDNSLSVLSSWNHSLHFCQWKGVTCSRRRQRVTMLNLASLNLAGLLSPHIGNLTFLKKIRLEENKFHGEIPHEIGHLYRLQHLALYQNYFSGNLPTNLSHCLDISKIILSSNNIGGYVPAELSSLSNLQVLDLSVNNFIGPIPSFLGNLSSLHILYLDSNHLVGKIPSFSLLFNLKVLDLGDNNLSGMVPLPIYNISSIQIIGLYQNQLQGELPPYLGLALPNLMYLLIEINEFSGSFPLSITNASKLVDLDISKNSFTGPLPMNLGCLHNLQILTLYRNQLGTNKPNELSILVKSLTNITNLQQLDLSENGFIGELPYSIVNLSTNLTRLGLGSDYIFGSMPQEIGKLLNLVTLGLYELPLTGSIPSSVGMLSKLERLYLYGNKISGEIPSSIGNITRLAVLSLETNLLAGSIPVELGNLTNLLALSLSRNRLIGVIPEQIIETSSMIVQIFLEENQFTGALPSSMGWMKNLVKLVVSKNKFTGEIPSTLGNCLMLESLYLNDNLFQGIIPSSFKQLRSINVMDLSHNNMSGQIPSFLGELKLFRALNLSYNMFEGEVPTKGVFKNVSMISVVGNLELCGGIQALQLPTCPMNSPDKRRKSFPNRVLPLLITLPIFILLVSVALILYRLKRPKEQQPVASILEEQYPRLSYGELHQATNGFSATNLIGEGRYGSVYKGVLNLGEQIVAVKVLNVEIHGANTSFLAECETYRNIRHRNLVKIITSCSSIDFKGCEFKALVLEFMPRGSLDSWLHPSAEEQQNNKQLTILQRLSIAIDVASAVDYLHHHCHTRIVHCDLKPSNILLDEDFDAHVADFGLTRFLANTKHQQTSSISIKGTIGYIPPEYGMDGEVSPQGDVYSYGILLLEMFTGKGPTDSIFANCVSLRDYTSEALPQKVMEIVDPRIIIDVEDGSTRTESRSTSTSSKIEVCLTSILQIGILCCSERPKERMDIKNVLMELTTIKNLLVGEARQRE